MNLLMTFIQKAIGQGVAILFGATGEIVTEKSGNLNLGIPGVMNCRLNYTSFPNIEISSSYPMKKKNWFALLLTAALSLSLLTGCGGSSRSGRRRWRP